MPNWPESFPPQQYTTPSDVSPQVWDAPAARLANTTPPLTAAGVIRDVPVVPSPSCPAELSPQQYALPAAVSPHE